LESRGEDEGRKRENVDKKIQFQCDGRNDF
jgi:hypothetical protein